MKTRILLATLGLGISALGQSSPPPTITLEIPIEAAGHSFSFIDDYNGNLLFSGLPTFDALTMKFILKGTPDISHQTIPSLLDLTDGTSEGFSPQTLTGPVTLQATVFGGGTGTIGYALGEERLNHTFALVAPGLGWAFPVSNVPTASLSAVDSDGNWQLAYGFFNAYVATEDPELSPANSVLVDLTTQQQSKPNLTDLRYADAWVPRSVALPTRAVTFSIGEVTSEYSVLPGATFTLHTSSGNMQGLVPFIAEVSGSLELRIGGQVGIREEYWWTRDGTAETTEHFFMEIGHTAVAKAGAGLSAPVSDVQTVTFTIGEDHYGESLWVLQNGTLTPLDSGTGGQNMLVTWDQNGDEVQYHFDYFSASVDMSQQWELVSVNANSAVIESFGQATDLRDGFTPFNPVPPIGQVSVSVPLARWESFMNGQIQLLGGDGTAWAVTSPFGQTAGLVSYMYWSGAFIGTPLERWSYIHYIPATAPLSTTDWQQVSLLDNAANESSGPGAGGMNNDFSKWMPVIPLNVNLPVSRWNQELYIITSAGGMFPVTKGNIQGLWSFYGSGTYFTSYGYFDATSQAHAGADWWVYAPYGNQGMPEVSEVNGNNIMAWNPASANDADGDGLPDWYEYVIGTSDDAQSGWDTDGDGISDFAEVSAGTSPTHAKPMLTVTTPVGATWLN